MPCLPSQQILNGYRSGGTKHTSTCPVFSFQSPLRQAEPNKWTHALSYTTRLYPVHWPDQVQSTTPWKLVILLYCTVVTKQANHALGCTTSDIKSVPDILRPRSVDYWFSQGSRETHNCQYISGTNHSSKAPKSYW